MKKLFTCISLAISILGSLALLGCAHLVDVGLMSKSDVFILPTIFCIGAGGFIALAYFARPQ